MGLPDLTLRAVDGYLPTFKLFLDPFSFFFLSHRFPATTGAKSGKDDVVQQL